jgi:hypothetical protein
MSLWNASSKMEMIYFWTHKMTLGVASSATTKATVLRSTSREEVIGGMNALSLQTTLGA